MKMSACTNEGEVRVQRIFFFFFLIADRYLRMEKIAN